MESKSTQPGSKVFEVSETWAEKVIDPGWITDTAKKLRKEAEGQVKSILKPPKDTDISLDGQIIMMFSPFTRQ